LADHGDLGRIDSDGYLFVTGRARMSSFVAVTTSTVTDREALAKSPAVLHAAAVGKPDAYAGELPVAYVQLVPGSQANASDLIAFVAEHIAKGRNPEEIFMVERVPLTDVGKPIKTVLRRTPLNARSERFVGSHRPATRDSSEPHVTQGTLVTIRVMDSEPTERDILAARLEEVMDRYSFAYVIEWLRESQNESCQPCPLPNLRSLLFVPGSREDFLPKAAAAGRMRSCWIWRIRFLRLSKDAARARVSPNWPDRPDL